MKVFVDNFKCFEMGEKIEYFNFNNWKA
jgi:hypothetical protein